jgi:hypothetical protein
LVVSADKVGATAVLVQLDVIDSPKNEDVDEEITGLKKMVKHAWVELRKDENLWLKKQGRSPLIKKEKNKSNTILDGE